MSNVSHFWELILGTVIALLPLINPQVTAKYGIEITSFIVENVSVPPEVEAAIDKRSSMGVIGNLNDYVKFQMAESMTKGGDGGGSPAAAAGQIRAGIDVWPEEPVPANEPGRSTPNTLIQAHRCGSVPEIQPLIGQLVKAFVVVKAGHAADDALCKELIGFGRKRLGPAVAPKEIAFVESLPKTRSGKIMRRLLKARELGLPEGDISTLEGGA